MKQRIFIYIIIFQIVIIGALVLSIYKKRNEVLGTASVNTISKNDISIIPSGNLKYFYEPKVNNKSGKDTFIFTQDTKLYTISSDSLNDRFDYSPGKPEGVFRIITLGDSVTFGLHVPTKDNWTEVLEDELNDKSLCSSTSKFEVINLAVSGYDSEYSVERFKKRGVKYNPDLIIWMQVDLLRLDELLIPAIKDIANKTTGSPESEGTEKFFFDARKNVINEFKKEKVIEYNKKSIESLTKYFKGQVVIAPYFYVSNWEILDGKDWLKNVTQQIKNWHYFDGMTDITKHNGIFEGDGHPNIEGHKMMARDILDYLKSNNLITCSK